MIDMGSKDIQICEMDVEWMLKDVATDFKWFLMYVYVLMYVNVC